MAQSLVKNYIHIVFSTKHRQPLIDQPIENELFSYLGGICKNLECQPIIVGGYEDHTYYQEKFHWLRCWKKSNHIRQNG